MKPFHVVRILLFSLASLTGIGLTEAQNIPTPKPAAVVPAKQLPIAGEVFTVESHTAFLILPDQRLPNQPIPWVWYAPTLPGLPAVEEKWMFDKFFAAGIAIAGIDVGESYGSPAGRLINQANS